MGIRARAFARKWLLPPGVNRFFLDLRRGMRPGGQPAKKQWLDPANAQQTHLTDLLSAQGDRVVWIAAEKLRLWGRGLSAQQNQFVRYLREGLPSLRAFYDIHQPRDQFQCLGLTSRSVGPYVPVSFPVKRPPWGFEERSTRTPEHGPISDRTVLREAKRLDSLSASVESSGFFKRGDGFIYFGPILIDDTNATLDYVVVIVSGIHRTSLLGHLEWPIIPAIAAPSFVARDVRLSQLSNWPGVLDGTYSPEAARAYFLAHFRRPTEVLFPSW